MSPSVIARQRIYGWFIDMLIVFGVSFWLGGLTWFLTAGYILFRDSLFEGQSLGKRILGLKVVVGQDRRRCGPWDSVLRNLLWVIPIVQIVMGLTGLHYLVHDPKGRHWGDRLAKTLVVAA